MLWTNQPGQLTKQDFRRKILPNAQRLNFHAELLARQLTTALQDFSSKILAVIGEKFCCRGLPMTARFSAEILASRPKAKQRRSLLDFRKSSGDRPYLSHIALPLGPLQKTNNLAY
jgi:hypothetical protein